MDSNPYDSPPPIPETPQTVETDRDVRMWATLLHLSLLAGFAIPGAGFIVPIVIWQVKKDEMPALDAHGRVVANWLISLIIYTAASVVLTFFLIGIPLLFALGIVTVAFPIIGGLKANNGELWEYPFTIPIV